MWPRVRNADVSRQKGNGMSRIPRALPPQWRLRAIDRINPRVVGAAITVAIADRCALRIPKRLTSDAECDVAHRVRNKMPTEESIGAALCGVRQIAGIQNVHDLITRLRA